MGFATRSIRGRDDRAEVFFKRSFLDFATTVGPVLEAAQIVDALTCNKADLICCNA
jgi:hypothetical protein